MGLYAKIFEYRRLAYVLIALAAAHLLLVAAAVYLVVRYHLLWAIPVILWLPLTIVPFRVTAGWLAQVFQARDDDVIAASGITAVQPAAGSREAAMLDNIAGEIAVATGSPQPDAMVCESDAVNAFISPGKEREGRETRVVFTTAMAAQLNRQELQGVTASLYAHLGNFDRMFISMVGAMFFSVFAAADVFLLLNALNWHFGGSGDFSTGPLVVILVLGMLAGPLLASRVAQTLVIRRSRLLDDAAALDITRDPDSLIAALRRLDGGATLEASGSLPELHFFFDRVSNPRQRFNPLLVGTHPSPGARIKALEPVSGGWQRDKNAYI